MSLKQIFLTPFFSVNLFPKVHGRFQKFLVCSSIYGLHAHFHLIVCISHDPQMEVEKEMEEQFVAVQSALAQVPTSRINNEEAVKIHEMSQVCILASLRSVIPDIC